MPSTKELRQYGIFGAVGALFATLVVLPLLAKLPTLTVELATINIRESITGIPTGISNWVLGVLGIAELTTNQYIMVALLGAIAMITSAYALDALNMLKGDKKNKLFRVIFGASALGALVVISQTGIPTVITLIGFGINAFVLSWIFIKAEEVLGTKFIP